VYTSYCYHAVNFSFFFQAEDGIRYRNVTGVQTCALPIFSARAIHSLCFWPPETLEPPCSIQVSYLSGNCWINSSAWASLQASSKIGRASCRERVALSGGGVGSGRTTRASARTSEVSAAMS